MKKFLSALLILTLFVSCSIDNTPVDYVTKNEKDISDFIAKNHLTVEKSNTGLYYMIEEPGTGAQPTAYSNVTVTYKGFFLDGTIFDQNTSPGITIGLDQVIKGWTEGLQHFKEGGKGVLFVPAHLGYGNYNYNGIPGGSVLVFEINLISVNN